jgi:anti-sigma factor RsiW
MTCLDLDALVYPYLDGELEDVDRKDLEDHLGTCVSCAGRVGSEAAFQGALHRSVRVQRAPAPEALRAMLHAGIQREHRRVQIVSWARWGGAALIAATAGVAWIQLRPPPRDLVADEAVLRYQRHLPLEVRNAAHEKVEAWFDDKLAWRVPVPRLPNARLDGARLSNLREYDAAYIAYEANPAGGTQGRRMILLVIADPEKTQNARPWPDVQVRSANGNNVASWRTGDLVYELVSDIDADALRTMLTQARPSTPLPPMPARPSTSFASYGARRWPTLDITPVATR